jgi:hypothetical protein
MNQNVTGWKLTQTYILCDPVTIVLLNLQTLEPDSNQIAVVICESQFAAQL